MRLTEIIQLTHAKLVSGSDPGSHDLQKAFSSDLMSDVLAIASLKELAAVILVKGLEPDEDTIEHSREEGIPVLGTEMNTFELAGRLYNLIK